MKKTLLVAIMAVIMIAFASCGGNNGHSKAFNQASKIYNNMIEEVNKAKTCDDVDMAAFGVLGLLGVDGIDKLDEAETKELERGFFCSYWITIFLVVTALPSNRRMI